MTESKKHKLCKIKCKNKLAGTHNCRGEVPINRNGAWNLLDLECPSINPKFKDCAIECEINSNRYNRESNWKDLLAWKKKNPSGEIFQISDALELDINKLKKRPIFQKRRF